jgi:ABC-type transport system involved in cytochrome bd biosynthesis fused ATPase/permease subunit
MLFIYEPIVLYVNNSNDFWFDLVTMIKCSLVAFIIIFIVTAKISIIFAVLITLLLIGLCVFRYNNIISNDHDSWVNYNDLLKDFIYKFNTIKKLNIFDFCYKKLDENKDSNLVILREDYNEDTFFYNALYIYGFIIISSLFIKFDSFMVILGYMCFYAIMAIKFRGLIYKLVPTIKNILNTYANFDELENIFKDNIKHKDISTFKTITLKNMLYECVDTPCSIRVDNFEIEKGDEISIIGKPGQGKSTILNILSGMYKLSTGSILIDGEELKDNIDLAHLSFNDQVFNLSLRENLSLGMKVSDEVILQYIDEAGLSEWFGLLGNGLDTILDQKYIEINEEELIKLNIVRGIVLDKSLYLIDDFGEYLDIDSEKRVAEMIKKYLKKKTFIIVAHKPIFTTICKKHYFIKNHTLLEKETLL